MPAKNLISVLDTLVGDCTYMMETPNGYRVEVRHPQKGTIVLWEDEMSSVGVNEQVNK